MITFNGFIRSDGRAGTRNHVLVLSTVSCCNAVVRQIIAGSQARSILNNGGCAEADSDIAQERLALTRVGQHPNVAGVLVVGLGCEPIPADEIAHEISKSTPVERLNIQDEGGVANTVLRGREIVERYQKSALQQERVPCEMSKLVMSVHCGGSDWTTALAGNTALGAATDLLIQSGGSVIMSGLEGLPGSEHVLAQRAVDHETGLRILDMVAELRNEFEAQYGQSIEKVNPTPGNKVGGITTLVEKSTGNIRKIGTATIQGILMPGETIPRPGVWLVDSRSKGPDAVPLSVAAIQGAQVALFSTGRGTPIGSPVIPVIKVTGNPSTYDLMPDMIDFNAGIVMQGTSVESAGKMLYQRVMEVASGQQTRAEMNYQYEFTIPIEMAREKAGSRRC
jgi:altronate dehydratase